MILVDSSVWIDHFRRADPVLTALLNRRGIMSHPFVVGELSLGCLSQRDVILRALQDLPQAVMADDAEVIAFINRHRLHGRSIGYVDAHLLAAVQLTSGATLWTRDQRLNRIADEHGISADPA